MVGKHRGDDFLQGRRSGVNPFHVLSWLGNNTRELCCILRSRLPYSQPNSSLYCTLYCCRYSCYSFRLPFLSHTFIVCTYAWSTLVRSPSHLTLLICTHFTHHPITKRGSATLSTKATADAVVPFSELELPPLSLMVWKYFRFPVSYVDSVHVVDEKATVCKLHRH